MSLSEPAQHFGPAVRSLRQALIMDMADGAPHLTRLPAEILHDIFKLVDPQDLGRLPCTCRFLGDFVKGNQKLCKDVYLNHLDEPKEQDLDWKRELRDYVRLGRVCAAPCNDPVRDDDLTFVHDTVTRLLRNATPSPGTHFAPSQAASRNASIASRLFREEPARTAFLTRSFLFQRGRGQVDPVRFPETPRADHQRSAQLHCLFGRPILNCGRTRSSRMYPFACSKVYDLRQYTAGSRWGPFMADGSDRVDWEKVEAVMIVLGSNIKAVQGSSPVFDNVWGVPFAGSWSGSWVPTPSRTLSDLDAPDPYGIAGTWLRVVCFIDYNDFFKYNFLQTRNDSLPANVPRPALDVGEATRLIIMKVHVTKIEPPGEQDGQDLPVVHFEGISRALDGSWDDNANSDLRGLCRLTREGEVRWTTFSIFDGQERWRSEGVQVGGIKSARGVLGNWFDADYDEHGPAGPTAFWKMSDPREDDGDEVMPHDFLPIIEGFDLDFSDEDFDGDYVMGEWGEDEEDEEIDEEDEHEAMERDLEALAQAEGEEVEIIDLNDYPPPNAPQGP